jgi:hypothetical protein
MADSDSPPCPAGAASAPSTSLSASVRRPVTAGKRSGPVPSLALPGSDRPTVRVVVRVVAVTNGHGPLDSRTPTRAGRRPAFRVSLLAESSSRAFALDIAAATAIRGP